MLSRVSRANSKLQSASPPTLQYTTLLPPLSNTYHVVPRTNHSDIKQPGVDIPADACCGPARAQHGQAGAAGAEGDGGAHGGLVLVVRLLRRRRYSER